MSADNFFIIRRHPAGGYAAVMGFASDVDDNGDEIAPEIAPDRDPVFATISDALTWALDQHSEYGVDVDPECNEDYAAEDPDYDMPMSTWVSPVQVAFSNRAIHQQDARWASGGLHLIAEAVAESRGDVYSPYGYLGLLTGNDGGEPFENDMFALRPYCWCDGDAPQHENGCPPNFEHKPSGLVISWYKHAGRGITANTARPDDWPQVVAMCLTSVGIRPRS